MYEQRIINDILGIVRRRKLGFIIAFIPVLVVGIIYAYSQSPMYRSQTTILIEGQQIPLEYVRTAVTRYIDERLAIIRQQVLSRTKLLEIVNQHNLYAEMRNRYTVEEIISKMRESIRLRTISAEVSGGRAGRGGGSATIAFILSYEGLNPAVVQRVTNVLASLYLEENVKTREKRAAITTEYLQNELENIKAEQDSIWEKITELKIKHFRELPEYTPVNLQTLERFFRDRDQLDLRIRTLQERGVFFQSQLLFIKIQVAEESPKSSISPLAAGLENLKLQLLVLGTKLSDKHPDIKQLNREIKDLEAQIKKSEEAGNAVNKSSSVAGQSAGGPVQGKGTATASDVPEELLTNPNYLNIMTQLNILKLEISRLEQEKKKIKSDIDVYQKRIKGAPLIEKEYANLNRDYQHASQRYNETVSRLAQAKAAQALEETQRSERFTILEPAQRPSKPFKPDRRAIIMVAFVLACGAGAGFAGIRESLDNSIKTQEQLVALSGLPVLSILPLVKTEKQRKAGRIKIVTVILLIIIIGAATLYLIHTMFMPLDILWIKVQRRLIA
jgi:polysaccharide chain length determinant protein (PEP-CTERM system associated)